MRLIIHQGSKAFTWSNRLFCEGKDREKRQGEGAKELVWQGKNHLPELENDRKDQIYIAE